MAGVTNPTVSVIVPCGDRLGSEQCLGSLARQRPPWPFEVVLVDDGELGLEHDVRRWSPHIKGLSSVTGSRCGAGHARNTGAAAASSDRLVFVDADDVVGPAYLEALVGALYEHPMVCARMDLVVLNDPDHVDVEYGHPQAHGPMNDLGFLPFASGGSYGIRRELFDRIGGFDPELLVYEDVDIAWRAQLDVDAPPASFVPDAVLHYRLRVGLRDRWRQSYRYGRYLPTIYRRFGPRGMPRRAALRAIASNAKGLLRSLTLLRSQHDRSIATSIVALSIGKVVGSIRERVLYL